MPETCKLDRDSNKVTSSKTARRKKEWENIDDIIESSRRIQASLKQSTHSLIEAVKVGADKEHTKGKTHVMSDLKVANNLLDKAKELYKKKRKTD